MLNFKQFLKEFRTAPQGQEFNKEALQDFLKDSNQLDLMITLPGKKDIAVFEYVFDVKDKFIILTDRVERNEIIGYMWISNKVSTKYWQVMDVAIFNPYRGLGIGTDLYIKLINEGYNLINGFSLSKEAQKVWRKLPQFVNVYTWDKQADQLSLMDERPTEDTNPDDNKIRYFWMATKSKESIQESLTNKFEGTLDLFYKWKEGSTKLPSCFRYIKYSEFGDF